MAEEARITVTIDARTVEGEPMLSIIEAAARSDALTANVGCMGQGVCGACRCRVRRGGEREVSTRLAVLSDQRMGATGLYVKGGHVPMLSHPEVIADFLAKAASSIAT